MPDAPVAHSSSIMQRTGGSAPRVPPDQADPVDHEGLVDHVTSRHTIDLKCMITGG
jgi:hypothetical protein